MSGSALHNIVIALVGTKSPGNLGAVARAMHNMGLKDLRLVSPQCIVNEESHRMARGGIAVLSGARTYPSLPVALKGIRLTIGTTGKTGGHRSLVLPPRALAPRILRHAAGQKVALIFGPEDTGLVDEDLMLCQILTRIPTNPRARSINLAQAVMILCYELHIGRLQKAPTRAARLAPFEQVEAMYEHLQAALLKIGFLHPQNARHMMFVLRRLLGRAGLEETDVGLLRGIARQIDWYSGRPLSSDDVSNKND